MSEADGGTQRLTIATIPHVQSDTKSLQTIFLKHPTFLYNVEYNFLLASIIVIASLRNYNQAYPNFNFKKAKFYF